MLTLICGLPRAGKTTYSKQYNCKVIHLDAYGNFRVVRDKVSMTEGDVVVEGVYALARQRQHLLDAYNGDYSKCIWLDVPKEIRKRRDEWRESMAVMKFDPPNLSEGWDEIIIIRGDDNVECHRR